jgi:NADPH2:quinone reductase
MRAAVIERAGEPPALRDDVPEPERGDGRALFEVLAAPLNPIDLSIAAGRFSAGPPQTPYVPGNEAVARVLEADGLEPGARAWIQTPAGFGSNGSLAERAVAAEAAAMPVDAELEDAVAAALGIAGVTAWLALDWRGGLSEGETVLVLGATGAVGRIAVQAAKLLGAGRVVAAARDAEALETLGADARVRLEGSERDADALREATGGGAELTIDPLWGEPVAAAVSAAPFGGRIVHLGQTAGAEAALRSGDVRGKMLSILGLRLAGAPQEARADAYRRLLEHASAGELSIEVETMPLEQVAEAWERQAAYPRGKLVLIP